MESTYDRLKRGSKRLQRFILANEGKTLSSSRFSDLGRVEVQLLHHSIDHHFIHPIVPGNLAVVAIEMYMYDYKLMTFAPLLCWLVFVVFIFT